MSAQSDTTGRSAGKLSRDLIVRTAIETIDRDANLQLTMRSLGRELGVEAMALYRYVSGREDLLEAVVAELLDGLHTSLDEQIAESWQGYLQGLAHAVREVAIQHPAAFPLIATRHPAAPWLRPPLRSLDLLEHFLHTLSGFGLDDDRVVATYRAFTSFLLGNLLLEAAVRGAETGPAEEPLDEGAAEIPNSDGQVDVSQLPAIMHFQARLSEDHSQAEFEISLEALLDRLETSISS